MFITSISTSSKFWLTQLPMFSGIFLHAFNVEISLQSIYPILWNNSELVAVGTLDAVGVSLPLLSVPLIETVRTEGVVACQELGLVFDVIIGLCTESTNEQVRWTCLGRGHAIIGDFKAEIQTNVLLSSNELSGMIPGTHLQNILWGYNLNSVNIWLALLKKNIMAQLLNCHDQCNCLPHRHSVNWVPTLCKSRISE